MNYVIARISDDSGMEFFGRYENFTFNLQEAILLSPSVELDQWLATLRDENKHFYFFAHRVRVALDV